MMSENEVVPLLITKDMDDHSLQLRFPPEYSEELLALLDEQGISHNTALEHSAGPAEWIEIVEVLGVAFGGAGGLAGLAAAISSFVRRNDGKRFVFKRGGVEVDSAGYSQADLEKLLRQVSARQQENDADLGEALDPSPENDN